MSEVQFGDQRLPPRFWVKVKLSPTCWDWMGAKTSDGYGTFWVRRGIVKTAHAMIVSASGPLEEGKVIDHICRNRKCVNPAHLRQITARENTLIGVGQSALNKSKTHCPKGHEYTAENTDPYHLRRGHRLCRTCKRTWDRERWRAKSAKLREKKT